MHKPVYVLQRQPLLQLIIRQVQELHNAINFDTTMYIVILIIGLLYLMNVLVRAVLYFLLPIQVQYKIGYIGLCILLMIPYKIENYQKISTVRTINLLGRIYYINFALFMLAIWLGYYFNVV